MAPQVGCWATLTQMGWGAPKKEGYPESETDEAGVGVAVVRIPRKIARIHRRAIDDVNMLRTELLGVVNV